MPKLSIKVLLKRILIFIIGAVLLTLIIIAISIPLAKSKKPSDLIPADNSTPITIDNINIIDMSNQSKDKILYHKQLVISDGVIVAINPTGTEVSSKSRLINAKGAYVVPGLFDMHVHLYERKYLALNLAYGVTSVRAMNGRTMHLRWKQELNNKEWLGSNLIISSPILDGVNADALSQAVATPEEGREQVRRAKTNGYDFIKAYGYLGKDSFEAIVDEANRLGMPLAKHGPHPVSGSDWKWLEGMQSLEHVEDIFQGPLNYEFDYSELKNVAKRIKDLDVPVVPTLETFDHLTQTSKSKQKFINNLELDYLNPLYFDIMQHFTVERWLNTDEKQIEYLVKENNFLADITKALHEEGVMLLVGSDAGTNHTIPGIATHNEMRLLRKSGLSNYEVLEAATINAAKTLGLDELSGSVETGKIADLLIIQNNPLEDINELQNIVAVVKNGQWLSKKELETLKVTAKNNQNYYWSVIKLLESMIDRRLSK